MSNVENIRSVSFDTSFLLKENPLIDRVIKQLVKDNIPCYLTTTVVSELEQLKIWGRITKQQYKKAIKRWKNAYATIIDFKNNFFSSAFGRECIVSMKEHHGVSEEDIRNDCSIIVSGLKNGVDLFLSEDYHFTSKVTEGVIEDITHKACSEYQQMCGTSLHSINVDTFLAAYSNGSIDLDIIEDHMKFIRKDRKRL